MTGLGQLKHQDFFRNKIDAVCSCPGIIHTQKDSKMPLAVKEDASIVSLGTIYQTMQQGWNQKIHTHIHTFNLIMTITTSHPHPWLVLFMNHTNHSPVHLPLPHSPGRFRHTGTRKVYRFRPDKCTHCRRILLLRMK